MLIRDMKGQAMLVVMVLTLAMFLMCSAVLALGTSTRKIAVFEVNQDKAYYTAEAGIEKVLADARYGPVWLRDLSVGMEYDFLANVLGGEKSYGEGIFEYIKVKKLAEDDWRTSLEIECKAKCKSSMKRVRVNADLETVYIENLFRGLWVAGGDAVIAGGSQITGDIYSPGMVVLQREGASATEINGDIYTLGGVSFTGTGPLAINGFIYVDDINKAPEEVRDITMVLPAGELAARIPGSSGFPALLSAGRLSWYQKNAGYNGLPPVDNSVMVFQNGIYFLSGDYELSGTYRGSALIVVDGDVALGSLVKSGDSDCLAVIAAGTVSSGPGCGQIDALIYSSNQLQINEGVIFKGSVLAPDLAGPGSPVNITFDYDMLNAFRDTCGWTTCFVRVTKWNE
ncbi:hypothetical protein ACOBQJ_02210 [Pelotomaculum propionicicum]|uniref:hypothetical protein n=1 Tax=Pelotomaculum propionicicum TaxID=258475 RepID=UPI003B822841